MARIKSDISISRGTFEHKELTKSGGIYVRINCANQEIKEIIVNGKKIPAKNLLDIVTRNDNGLTEIDFIETINNTNFVNLFIVGFFNFINILRVFFNDTSYFFLISYKAVII